MEHRNHMNQGSHLNSHLVNLTFTAQGVKKENFPADFLQIICKQLSSGEEAILGETEVLQVEGNPSLSFSTAIQAEYVFQRKQELEL